MSGFQDLSGKRYLQGLAAAALTGATLAGLAAFAFTARDAEAIPAAASLALAVIFFSLPVWALGLLILGTPIWFMLDTLGVRSRLAAVLLGAGLCGGLVALGNLRTPSHLAPVVSALVGIGVCTAVGGVVAWAGWSVAYRGKGVST